MGIKHLNRYLTNHCSANAISKRALGDFRNKVFVIDASIYLYRFAETNMLIEGFYNMISIFKKYRITPVFIFDGKPPIEKKDLLEKRKVEKHHAEKIYNELKTQLNVISNNANTEPIDNADIREKKQEILNEMETLKKRFVRIKPHDIQVVKNLMTAYGTLFIESFGEADQLCAYLVKQNLAWACVSDDMDMFLYGCPRVLRHVSLVNHTAILYDTQCILDELNLTYESFRDITILSGTDYNIHQKMHLYDIMKWYNVYLDETVRTPLSETLAQQSVGVRGFACEDLSSKDNVPEDNDVHFYDWLTDNTNIVVETSRIDKIRDMFNLDEYKRKNEIYLKQIDTMSFRNREVIKPALVELLESDGFIFVA
jgi:hypothetical protein